MILQFHIGQAKAHVSSSSHGHDVNGRAKSNQEGCAHSSGRDSVDRHNLVDNGQNAISQGITVDEHTQRAVDSGKQHVQMGSHALGHGGQNHLSHGVQHGALAHDAR